MLTPLENVVETWFADEDDEEQVTSIFGEITSAELATALTEAVGQAILGCTYEYLSSGATVELALADGGRCVLKAARGGAHAAEVRAAVAIQQAVAEAGFPAPPVLRRPVRIGEGEAWVMGALDRGEPVRYTPALRTEMAHTFARLVALAETLALSPEGLKDASPPVGRLWPTPHATYFDFSVEAPTIDGIARQARERLDVANETEVVAHTDFCRQNCAFREGRIVATFDWDSTCRVPEVIAVAGAAAFHQQDWRLAGDDPDVDAYWQGIDETIAFVDDYSSVRSPSWTDEQLQAALLLALAYQARCGFGEPERRLVRFAQGFGYAVP